MTKSPWRIYRFGLTLMVALVALAFVRGRGLFRSRSAEPFAPAHTAKAPTEAEEIALYAGASRPRDVWKDEPPGPSSPPLRGLPPVPWPEENRSTPQKVELGKWLFFDTRLSSDGSISCARCHDPARAFTDGQATPAGIGGRRGLRNAPTLINRAYSTYQFFDGRAASLEEQVKGPLANPMEMTVHPTTDLAWGAVIARLKAVPGYVERFKIVFGTAAFTIDDVARAIATFERTLLSGNSPFDRYRAGDSRALSPAQVRGSRVFFQKAACDKCHLGPELTEGSYEFDERSIRLRQGPMKLGFNFTDGSYQNVGIGMDRPDPDLGRYLVTGREEDKGAFKTPTLREVEHTAPYMHDGSLKTLEDVVEYYDRGGIKNPHLNRRIRPLHLTAAEKTDLVAFLKSLSGEGWQQITLPEEFPR
jgi:cytochrome c peroxidase